MGYLFFAAFLILILGLAAAVIFLITGAILLITLPLRRWAVKKAYLSKTTNKRIERGVSLVVIGLVGFSVYEAFYPPDSFYFGEFKEVTQRDHPISATILRKSASYPDLHGDYCSSSLMKLSASEYAVLLSEVSVDSRLVKGEMSGSREFNYVMRATPNQSITVTFERKVKGEEDHYLSIGFLDDHQSIVVHVCYT